MLNNKLFINHQLLHDARCIRIIIYTMFTCFWSCAMNKNRQNVRSRAIERFVCRRRTSSDYMLSLLVLLLYQVDEFKSASDINPLINPIDGAFINSINSLNTTWKAGLNFHSSIGYEFLETLRNACNSTLDKSIESVVVSKVSESLPDEFDSRVRWPKCPTIREIRDQGSCGSCWAIAAVESMTDRVCIHSNQKTHFYFSVENLLTCCKVCGNGCFGGSHELAWKYWVENGIVSGGSYNSHQGCQPYRFPPCKHYKIGLEPNCSSYGPTPQCIQSCESSYIMSYKDDLHFGKTWYSVASNEKAIKTEIFNNGPLEASFSAYEDFYVYKSGVYQHVKGNYVCDHAVKIIGWGTDRSNNIPYWLISNSFNSDWGDHGYFKMKRGSNECQIESHITAGIPLL